MEFSGCGYPVATACIALNPFKGRTAPSALAIPIPAILRVIVCDNGFHCDLTSLGFRLGLFRVRLGDGVIQSFMRVEFVCWHPHKLETFWIMLPVNLVLPV
jgi:hypothetical protein